jgi:hypothetical protein
MSGVRHVCSQNEFTMLAARSGKLKTVAVKDGNAQVGSDLVLVHEDPSNHCALRTD